MNLLNRNFELGSCNFCRNQLAPVIEASLHLTHKYTKVKNFKSLQFS